ncbi:MAG TPA: hybrid sensor histidine kinase/response regulator, partial [Burkholderiaceae bacterium]|nr:hybrid sensor histidine kinase/response regulator [Burkholderiaceae bacterium]
MAGKAKLLVVDDVRENVTVLEALLERDDLELLKAYSAQEALELLLAHEVALALLDVRMPGIDGFELAELMRGTERTRHVPIIFLTAGNRDYSRTFRGYEAGAVDFMYKPIDPHVLRSKVDVFVQLQRQREQLALQLDALREALRLNEMFAAVLGHDLRNPLSAILNGAALLQRRSGDELVVATAQRIRRSGERMSRMIDQLLDLSRTRAGGFDALELAPIDLVPVCQKILEELEPAAAQRRARLVHHGDTVGRFDADRLAQVFSNLLGNALRHGDPREPVDVTIDGRDAASLVVSVRNGGVIAAELLPQLFEPFRSGAAHGSGGLGLGLYIVHQIVLAHGGRVSVRSTPQSGTTFEVVLPREVAAQPGAAPAAAPM